MYMEHIKYVLLNSSGEKYSACSTERANVSWVIWQLACEIVFSGRL